MDDIEANAIMLRVADEYDCWRKKLRPNSQPCLGPRLIVFRDPRARQLVQLLRGIKVADMKRW